MALSGDNRRRRHFKAPGELCTFSGTRVEPDFDTTIEIPLPPIYNPEGPYRHSDRATSSAPCGECGRWTPTNPSSGEQRRHRIEADNPIAPWCPGDTPNR